MPLSDTRSDRAGRRLPAAVFTLGMALLVLLTGCGVRLDVPPPEAPVPQGQDAVRQEAAQAVEMIAASARVAAQQEPDEVAALLQAVADDAEAHLDALGGVWEPPPRPEPEDDAGDDPAEAQQGSGTGQVADADGADVLAALEAAAGELRGNSTAADADLATLLVSISVNQHLYARDLRSALDLEALEAPEAADDPFPAEFGPEAAPVARILDSAGYLDEVRAGRTSGDESARLADRAENLRTQAELVATRGAFSGTAEDPREPAYELDLEDLSAQAAALTQALVPAWMDLLGPAEDGDRDLIATQVLLAARAVYGQGEPVPTFPGRAN